jgi:cobalt-zinc-cadmium efflux system protein
MITGLLIVGLTSHSLGVLAAGGDFIADSTAIALGLMAVNLRDKHGKHQAPTYMALINSLLLLGITIFVLVQAVERLITQSPEVHGLPVLVVSIISTLAMASGVVILGRGAGNEDLHMRSVLLDTISDGLAAAAVAIAGGIIFITHGVYWLDAAVAVIISIVIGFGALKLLRDVALALYRGIPVKTNRE